MHTESEAPTVAGLIARLSEECSRSVSPEIALAAATATRKAFNTRVLTPGLERRLTAYFRAVVRRRVLRRGGPKEAAARLVIAAVVEDLRSAGRPARDVLEELERGWHDKVPSHVLDEFRESLCA